MFEEHTESLYVVFQEKDALYKYSNVSKKEFETLFGNKKKSVGELFYSNIRNVKSYEVY
jgi:hypothetical protein